MSILLSAAALIAAISIAAAPNPNSFSTNGGDSELDRLKEAAVGAKDPGIARTAVDRLAELKTAGSIDRLAEVIEMSRNEDVRQNALDRLLGLALRGIPESDRVLYASESAEIETNAKKAIQPGSERFYIDHAKWAVDELRRDGTVEAYSWLTIVALEGKNHEVSRYAAEQLAEAGRPEAVYRLAEIISKHPAGRRSVIHQALAGLTTLAKQASATDPLAQTMGRSELFNELKGIQENTARGFPVANAR